AIVHHYVNIHTWLVVYVFAQYEGRNIPYIPHPGITIRRLIFRSKSGIRLVRVSSLCATSVLYPWSSSIVWSQLICSTTGSQISLPPSTIQWRTRPILAAHQQSGVVIIPHSDSTSTIYVFPTGWSCKARVRGRPTDDTFKCRLQSKGYSSRETQ
ncbi:unnamed protein product, partial [Ectocarpus sp. 4 AP-2014]